MISEKFISAYRSYLHVFSSPFIVLHRLTAFLTTLTPRSKLIITRYVPEG